MKLSIGKPCLRGDKIEWRKQVVWLQSEWMSGHL